MDQVIIITIDLKFLYAEGRSLYYMHTYMLGRLGQRVVMASLCEQGQVS